MFLLIIFRIFLVLLLVPSPMILAEINRFGAQKLFTFTDESIIILYGFLC